MKTCWIAFLTFLVVWGGGCANPETPPACEDGSCVAVPPMEPRVSCSSADQPKPYVTPANQPAVYRFRRPSGKRLPGIHNLEEAVTKAKAENKFVFVQYGRELCSNCQKVWDLLACKDVKLPENMLYADVDCDDPDTVQFFTMNFSIDDASIWLPFIVVVAPDGSQLASCSGLHEPQFYRDMIENAVKDWETLEAQQ